MSGQASDIVVTQLRWRNGLTGCLLPFLVGICLLFGFAAVDPSLATSLAEGRRGWWIRVTEGATLGGINVPLALVTLYLAWEALRLGWRWADEIAAKATPEGLRLHRSVRVDAIAWSDIRDVSYVILGRGPSLLITLHDGSTCTVRGIDNVNQSAEQFAAYARHQAGVVDR